MTSEQPAEDPRQPPYVDNSTPWSRLGIALARQARLRKHYELNGIDDDMPVSVGITNLDNAVADRE